MEDILKLLPHSRKDPKYDKSEPISAINEIAELGGCKLCVYFEARKGQDLYMWVGAAGTGPSCKFLLSSIRPMRDIRLTGNCLLGSRPFLSFDGSFDGAPHLRVMRQMLADVFSTPKGHPRSKPFHDHVLSFSLFGGKVVVRHYQVVPPLHDAKKEDTSLVEIGPRFTMEPIKIFGGCFGGESLYTSGSYVTPNAVRSERKRQRSKRTISGVAQKERRRKNINVLGRDLLPEDELADVFLE
mmetsp:Transcript_30393/g.51960  ORF Transcript_30393/g.51960 Transcript_30393/m.51960 type:complete len:241 (+) Transcript_30393:1067-1789(+)